MQRGSAKVITIRSELNCASRARALIDRPGAVARPLRCARATDNARIARQKKKVTGECNVWERYFQSVSTLLM
jgi:hypothetical protein